jgi:hypothetical protein
MNRPAVTAMEVRRRKRRKMRGIRERNKVHTCSIPSSNGRPLILKISCQQPKKTRGARDGGSKKKKKKRYNKSMGTDKQTNTTQQYHSLHLVVVSSVHFGLGFNSSFFSHSPSLPL